jgi:hypothetical protein
MGLRLEYIAALRPCPEESLCAQRPTALMPAPARQRGGAQSRRSAAEHRGHPRRSASPVGGVRIGSVGTPRSLAHAGKPRSDLSAGRARGGSRPSCSLATTKKWAILDWRLTWNFGSSTIWVVLPVRSPLRGPSLHGRLAFGRSRYVGGPPAARGCEPREECGDADWVTIAAGEPVQRGERGRPPLVRARSHTAIAYGEARILMPLCPVDQQGMPTQHAPFRKACRHVVERGVVVAGLPGPQPPAARGVVQLGRPGRGRVPVAPPNEQDESVG